MPTSLKRVLVTVHGIRTFGQWQERLNGMVHASAPNIEVETYKYGYFNALAFSVPLLRYFSIRAFRTHLVVLSEKFPGLDFVIVSHSFGTKIVVDALRGMDPRTKLNVRLLILAGSVLSSNSNIGKLIASGRVHAVVNDCGIKDNVLLLSQFFVLGTGMAGRIGFVGFSNKSLLNRFFQGGHDLYFRPSGDDPNAFMSRWWLPAIIAEESIPEHDERRSPTWYEGVAHSFMLIANPVKLVMYFGLIDAAFYWGWYGPHQARDLARAAAALEQAHSGSRKAADLLASGDTAGAGRLSLKILTEFGLKAPDAYDVLYRALFDRSHPAQTLDVGVFQTDPTVRFQSDGTLVVLTSEGQLTVWTSEGAAVRRKEDVNLSAGIGGPVFTQDNQYIIYHDSESLGRLDLRDLSVRQFSSALTEPSVPATLIALDKEHVLGCDDRIIVEYRFEGERFPDATVVSVWSSNLPIRGRCNAFQLIDSDNVIVGTTSGELVLFNISSRTGRQLTAWRSQGKIASIDYMFVIPNGIIVNQIADDKLYLINQAGNLVKVFEGGDFWVKASENGKFVAYPPKLGDFQTAFIISPTDPLASSNMKPICRCEFIDFYDSSNILTLDEGGVVHARELISGDISYTVAILPREASNVQFDHSRHLLISHLGSQHLYVNRLSPKSAAAKYEPRELPGVFSSAKWYDETHILVEFWVLNNRYVLDRKFHAFLEVTPESLIQKWPSEAHTEAPLSEQEISNVIAGHEDQRMTSGQRDLARSWNKEVPLPGDHMDVEPTGASNVELRNFAGKAGIVDTVSTKPIFMFPAETVPISSVWVSSDRMMVACGYQDGSLRMWRLDLPEAPLVSLHAHATAIKQIEAQSSQSKLLSADTDGNIRIWPLYTVQQLVEAANAKYETIHPNN